MQLTGRSENHLLGAESNLNKCTSTFAESLQIRFKKKENFKISLNNFNTVWPFHPQQTESELFSGSNWRSLGILCHQRPYARKNIYRLEKKAGRAANQLLRYCVP